MLAFDLETTGLDPEVDDVTCACAYDPDAGVDLTFFFRGGVGDTPEAFFALLDGAARLCAANGLDSKTGTGGDAVVLAREGRWDELGAYCRQDTVKTRGVSLLASVLLPLRSGRAVVRTLSGRFEAAADDSG